MADLDKRLQIMKAAEKLFASRRYHEITLDDVARDARVGKGTIYRHFRNKDDLFLQAAMGGFDEMCALIRAHADEGAGFEERLLGACEAIVGFFEKRRHLFRMMQSEDARMGMCRGAPRQEWLARRSALAAAVGEILAGGAAKGRIRDDAPPETLAMFLLGMLRTYARDMEVAQGAPPGLGWVVDFFCRGAGAEGREGLRGGRG